MSPAVATLRGRGPNRRDCHLLPQADYVVAQNGTRFPNLIAFRTDTLDAAFSTCVSAQYYSLVFTDML